MERSAWIDKLKAYESPLLSKSLGQLFFTLSLYLILISAMFILLEAGVSYGIILLMSLPAAGFQVKIFIIMHDCGHQSYFKSTRANQWIGRICGFLTFTPYYDWRHAHAIHHSTVSNLEKRGIGDIWTMTVEEYKQVRPWKKRIYRLFRNPLFLFTVAPVFQFLILSRFPHGKATKKDNLSILLTDISLVGLLLFFHVTIGLKSYFLVILPVMTLASSFGVWLFYVQHQFEEVYWARNSHWSLEMAAMKGSSFYKLPRVLNWFSGNIGYHHIHHLNSHIPNYYLKKCYDGILELRKIEPINMRKSLKSLFLNLWDEKKGKMVHSKNLNS